MKKSFTISPRILTHLGEDLIKNEIIALVELVKNSYDACATYCEVIFNVDEMEKLNEIIVVDDGMGMDFDVIDKIWLTIGTDNKLNNNQENSCGRIPLGEKGIGRLSVHKLGNSISLTSRKRNCKQVTVDLDMSEIPKIKSVNDFKVNIQEHAQSSWGKNVFGTVINITNLKKEWDKKIIREAYRELTTLNSPFEGTNDSFLVKVTSNSSIFDDMPTYEEIKELALYRGRCKMRGSSIEKFEYTFKPWETLTKIDKGRRITLKDLKKDDLTIVDSVLRNPNVIDLEKFKIGPIELEVFIFEKDAQIFNLVNIEKKTVLDYLANNGGIRVFRDGIRVFDYGVKDDDWLGIDLKRISKVGSRVSKNIVIGSVKISRKESKGLREKTNREGFIEDLSFNAFKEAVNYALGLFVRERNTDKQRLATLYKKSKVIEPVLSDLDDAIRIVEDKVHHPETRDELLKYLGRIAKQYKDVKEILIKSANAGLNLSVVIHELEKLISQLNGSITRREYNTAANISKMLENIIRGYSVLIKKSEIKKIALNELISKAIDNYEFRFSDHSIKIISNHKEQKLFGYLSISEGISIILNLLDNAIYWLSKDYKKERIISIFITDKIDGYNSIIISDSGPGFNIPFDIAIEPFITGKPHNLGSGLGLHIANEMMKSMSGKLLFLEEEEIELPFEVVKHKATESIQALCFKKEK